MHIFTPGFFINQRKNMSEMNKDTYNTFGSDRRIAIGNKDQYGIFPNGSFVPNASFVINQIPSSDLEIRLEQKKRLISDLIELSKFSSKLCPVLKVKIDNIIEETIESEKLV